ncbi:hypothetical protein VTK26DRAFT_457 [Humicola hyalothermophila]
MTQADGAFICAFVPGSGFGAIIASGVPSVIRLPRTYKGVWAELPRRNPEKRGAITLTPMICHTQRCCAAHWPNGKTRRSSHAQKTGHQSIWCTTLHWTSLCLCCGFPVRLSRGNGNLRLCYVPLLFIMCSGMFRNFPTSLSSPCRSHCRIWSRCGAASDACPCW